MGRDASGRGPLPARGGFWYPAPTAREDAPDRARMTWRRWPRTCRLLRKLARWLDAVEARLADETVAAWWLQRRLCDIAVQEAPDHLRVGGSRGGPGRLSRSLFLLAPPELTDPGWLDPMIGLDCPFRLAIHLEGLDRKAERRRLKRRRRSLNVITLGAAQTGGVADVDMESAQAEARQQALETLDPAHAILRMGCYLTVFAESPNGSPTTPSARSPCWPRAWAPSPGAASAINCRSGRPRCPWAWTPPPGAIGCARRRWAMPFPS